MKVVSKVLELGLLGVMVVATWRAEWALVAAAASMTTYLRVME